MGEMRIDEGASVGAEEQAPFRPSANLSWLGGVALIVLGAIFLVGQFVRTTDLFWSVSLLGVGVTFLAVYLTDRARWWALIPAYIFAVTGAFIPIEDMLRGDLDAVYWLAAVSAPFLVTFLTSPYRRWWALIPTAIFGATGVFLALEPLLHGEWDAIYWLAVIGTPFLVIFATNPAKRWWALIPAYVFASTGTFLIYEPVLRSDWDAIYWLAAVGTPFFIVFLTNPAKRWWALIPAYVMGSTGVFLSFERIMPSDLVAAYWLLAIALPFLLVFVTSPAKRWWALIPGGILAAVAFGLMVSAIEFLFPVAMLIAGVYLLFRTMRRRELTTQLPQSGPAADRPLPGVELPGAFDAEPQTGPEADHA